MITTIWEKCSDDNHDDDDDDNDGGDDDKKSYFDCNSDNGDDDNDDNDEDDNDWRRMMTRWRWRQDWRERLLYYERNTNIRLDLNYFDEDESLPKGSTIRKVIRKFENSWKTKIHLPVTFVMVDS